MNKREAMKGIAKNMLMLSNTMTDMQAKGLRIAAHLIFEASDSMCGTGVYGCRGGDPCTIHKLPDKPLNEAFPIKLEYLYHGTSGQRFLQTQEEALTLAISMMQSINARPVKITKGDEVIWDIETLGAVEELERLTGQDAAG